MTLRAVACAAVFCAVCAVPVAAFGAATPGVTAARERGASTLEALVFPTPDIPALKSRGPGVMDELARLYARSDVARRTTIAGAFYQIGLRSPAARRALLADLHTPDPALRLQVQWALGRVSDDLEVVDALVEIMRRDGNALFRDKAACALAHDQVHLNERQKLHLYEKLVDALADENPQVRAIAAQALQIHTGQERGFRANAEPAARQRAIEEWKRWLRDYRDAL